MYITKEEVDYITNKIESLEIKLKKSKDSGEKNAILDELKILYDIKLKLIGLDILYKTLKNTESRCKRDMVLTHKRILSRRNKNAKTNS